MRALRPVVLTVVTNVEGGTRRTGILPVPPGDFRIRDQSRRSGAWLVSSGTSQDPSSHLGSQIKPAAVFDLARNVPRPPIRLTLRGRLSVRSNTHALACRLLSARRRSRIIKPFGYRGERPGLGRSHAARADWQNCRVAWHDGSRGGLSGACRS